MLTAAVCKQPAALRCSKIAASSSARSSSAKRTACAAASRDQPLWIFAAENNPRGTNYSMLDVRDAVEACSTSRNPEERAQCFLNYGLKSEMVDRYYDRVIKMEEALEEHNSEEDVLAQRMVRVAGFLLFLVVGCKVV